MKFQQRLVLDFPPDVTMKYMTDEKTLKYITDNDPELTNIEVLGDRMEGDMRIIEFRYTTEMSMPGPLKKLVGGATAQSMVMKFKMNTKTFAGTMEVQPSQMADKIKVAGKISLQEQGNKWVQVVEGDVSIKIFGVGKMAEKFLVEKMDTSAATEIRLRNEYMRTVEKG